MDIAKVSAGAAIIVALSSGVFFMEDRYVNAADFSEMFSTQEMFVKKELYNMKKRDLEDKIFMIDFKIEKDTADELDRAMRNRYKSQLDDLQR